MRWLYRHVFRGSKVLLVLGMITILALAVVHEMRQSAEHPPIHPMRPIQHSK